MIGQMISNGLNKIPMARWAEEFKIKYVMGMWNYVPLVSDIHVESANLILKTAQSIDELMEVFRLRQKLFLGEHDDKNNFYDCDEFDFNCDHLIIIDKSKNRIIATYRLLSSTINSRFYSSSEFELKYFLEAHQGERILELGRACVDKEFRGTSTLSLLWQGIGQYCQKVEADYLIGLSSVPFVSVEATSHIHRSLINQGVIRTDVKVIPHQEYAIEIPEVDEVDQRYTRYFPPLLRSYLSMGAVLYGLPAYDRAFRCLDYFTVLSKKDMDERFFKKYFS